jgi:hypothetical protein
MHSRSPCGIYLFVNPLYLKSSFKKVLSLGLLLLVDKKIKQRKKAYRESLAGMRYRHGQKLSFVEIGFRRGSMINCRKTKTLLFQYLRRLVGRSIEYFDVEVYENTESTKNDPSWRVHIHLIWDAPFIKQKLLVQKIESYIGDNCHVDIRLIDNSDLKKVSRYMLQYLNNQNGLVFFNKSRGWLPEGYQAHFKALKQEFFEYVPRGVREPMDDPDKVFKLLTQSSDAWRYAAFIDSMNDYIDECRLKRDIPQKPIFRQVSLA